MTPKLAFDVSPLSTLVGNSPAMKQVHRLVMRMGRSRFPVLILGETGTGKEVVARAIHNVDSRGPFVIVDCSSLVGPLMESELFGYSKGAFTGAHNQKLGLLDAANGGTAFFDEIGELPLDLQTKLLRVLQEKEFRAVGGLTQRSSNFRVIAATNRDLAVEVEAKRFRQDLFYRLNVMRLRLPPLREAARRCADVDHAFFGAAWEWALHTLGRDGRVGAIRLARERAAAGTFGAADGGHELGPLDRDGGSPFWGCEPRAGKSEPAA